jgi:hypothetical protein
MNTIERISQQIKLRDGRMLGYAELCVAWEGV